MPQGNEIHGRKSRRILQAVTYICLQRAEASVSSASVNVHAFCGYIDQEVGCCWKPDKRNKRKNHVMRSDFMYAFHRNRISADNYGKGFVQIRLYIPFFVKYNLHNRLY